MTKQRLQYLSRLTIIFILLFSLNGCAGNQDAASGTTEGISNITAEYKSEDLESDWDAATATMITLKGSSFAVDGAGAVASNHVLTITAAGTYVLSGTLTDGQILVSAGKDDIVRLVLNNADLSCSTSAPIYAKQAKKTILTLAPGSSNTVEDGTAYTYAAGEDEPDAAIFCKDDLTINGSGALTVNGKFNNGIGTKDDLIVTGGNIRITAVKDGLRGRDAIAIKDGNFNIQAGGDGLQSNNDEDPTKGWIVVDGGVFAITAGNDGIQAETRLQVNDGEFDLTTGGGSVNASTDDRGQTRPGWGQWGAPDDTQNTTEEEDTISAKGIKAGVSILIKGGLFAIDSSDDAVHSNDEIQIKAGEFSIASGDDGIHADSNLTVDGGLITIEKCFEGLESSSITINDGTIRITARDDGLNAAGGNDGSAQGGRPGENSFRSDGSYFIRINGGYISINADGDGVDANGAIYFSGGTVLVHGPTNNGNGAMDYDGTCQVTGGILVLAGSSGMVQAPQADSTQNSISIYYSAPQQAGTLVTLADASGKSILTFAPAKDYQSIVISSPELEQGKTYTLSSGGTATGKVTDGLYTGGATSGSSKLTEVTISGTVTSIADDGSTVSGNRGGMNPQGGAPGGIPGDNPNGAQGGPREGRMR